MEYVYIDVDVYMYVLLLVAKLIHTPFLQAYFFILDKVDYDDDPCPIKIMYIFKEKRLCGEP